jgi:hypothetical protein
MFGLLIFGLLLLTIISLWLMIERRKNYAFLLYFIPFFLLMTLSVYWTYTSILGMPKIGYPTKGLYLSHYVDEPVWIYLWILENRVPVAYKINYSKEGHDTVDGVRMETEQGEYMLLSQSELGEDARNEKKGNKGASYTLGGTLNFYKWEYNGTTFKK